MDNSGLVLVRDRLNDSTIGALIKIVQRLHVFFAQVEIVDVCVALDSAGSVTLWQGYPALLQTVSDKHLSSTFVVFLRDRVQGRVVGLLIAYKRAVCFDDNLVLVAVVDSFALLVPRVQLRIVLVVISAQRDFQAYLNLVNVRRPGLGILLQLLNMSNSKVADTNSLAPALLVCSL